MMKCVSVRHPNKGMVSEFVDVNPINKREVHITRINNKISIPFYIEFCSFGKVRFVTSTRTAHKAIEFKNMWLNA